MIAIDTNIIVRFLTNDDPIQYKKALNLFKNEWVLRFAYEFKPEQIASALSKLFGLANIHINHPALLAQTIAWHVQGSDFADAFHLAASQQYKKFYSFDKNWLN